MRNLAEGKCDILVIEPSSLTSGTGLEIAGFVQSFSSMIWTRKCNDPDEFELQVEANPENIRLFTEDRLILINDFDMDPESKNKTYVELDAVKYKFTDRVGIIESIDCKAPNDDEYSGVLTVKGRSLEALFERRIVWDPTELEYYNGAEKDTKYSDMITKIYEFMANDMIAPPLEGKKKKPDSTKFQNRAIWNIVFGAYGRADDASNPYKEEAMKSESHISRFFEEGTQYIGNYEGTSLLDVLKNVCDNYSLCMRTWLLIDIPGIAFGNSIMGLGKMDPYFYATADATNDARGLDIDSLSKISVIVFQFYVPTNNSFINNESGHYTIFSQNVDNIKDVQFTKSFSQLRNVAKIKGSDNKGENQIKYATAMNGEEEPTGWRRREIFVDAGDIEMEKTGNAYYENVYKPALEAAGRNSLVEHSRNRNYVFDGTTIIGLEHDTYEYGIDYKIGDFVQFFDEIFTESIECQITEIVESLDASDGYKMSASFENVINDFLVTDPLKYYYYTINDVNKVITITGIKLQALMDDGVGDLGIIEFIAYAFSSKKVKKKIKKKFNDDVVKDYEVSNPYDNGKKRLRYVYGTALNALYNAGVPDTTKVDSFGISEKYQDYSIKLNLIYSH